MIDPNKLLSAFVAISANERAPSGRYPPRCSLSTRRSSLSRSWAEVKPHHASEAYSREEMVVMRATSCSWAGGRPWVLSMRRAWMEEAQLDMSRLSGYPWIDWSSLLCPGPAGSPPGPHPAGRDLPVYQSLVVYGR